MIHTDSLMEANIISELVRHGYSQKWRRTRRGIAFGYARYTPDVELCIYHQGHSVRAIVELKAFSISEFAMKDRRRMLSAAQYYSHAIPLLYIKKTKQWYGILSDTKTVRILPPKPGLLNISQLPRPHWVLPVFTTYGHSYNALLAPLLLRKLADGLELGVRLVFGPSNRPARRYRKRR